MAFSAKVNIAEVQPASTGGINFELSLQYEGVNTMKIHNPLHFVQYSLTGSEKTQLFNNTKPPIPLVNRRGAIDATADFGFNILGVVKNGESLNIQEQVNVPTPNFETGDKQSYFLQISEYLNQQTGRLEDLPKGNYQLEVIFSIIDAATTADRPRSRTLKAQNMSITLEQPREN
jgi:hypothetical protein